MRSFLFGLALVEVWGSGVNSATHHWQDAVGELLAAVFALIVRRYWSEIKALVTTSQSEGV